MATMKDIARLVGVSLTTVSNVVHGNYDRVSPQTVQRILAAIDELKAKIGIKKTIRDYGIDETDFLTRLDSMVEQAFDDQCTGANPRYPLMSEIKQMYLNAYYGTDETK